MYDAMDRQRIERGLSWRQVADQLWEQSAELNRRRADPPISPSTMTGIARRGDTTCQHALFFLRWLGRAPESFLTTPRADTDATRLPAAGAGRRLRWTLGALHEALDARPPSTPSACASPCASSSGSKSRPPRSSTPRSGNAGKLS